MLVQKDLLVLPPGQEPTTEGEAVLGVELGYQPCYQSQKNVVSTYVGNFLSFQFIVACSASSYSRINALVGSK